MIGDLLDGMNGDRCPNTCVALAAGPVCSDKYIRCTQSPMGAGLEEYSGSARIIQFTFVYDLIKERNILMEISSVCLPGYYFLMTG